MKRTYQATYCSKMLPTETTVLAFLLIIIHVHSDDTKYLQILNYLLDQKENFQVLRISVP